ncbi:hypothetical protein GQ43DRAFT_267686 [Delitschia confertaspora ATCC 74209]|uniref:Protein kinase domain-containing protein n=1 Tax=Delitschia confertaspora ATCC 74209 TaxID=1513339 RepID=A0A9P4MUU1_9PLEO|nr:hypothetical protein GQ43DRAFT_267686 [Delitschia confertaspora ATCC 74209]
MVTGVIEPLGIVSLTFQVFSGVIKGYQLITEARHMPEDCQYLRIRLKTEQYRLLDWADVVKLDEQDDNLLISHSSKGLLLDVLDQQHKLLQHFGRLDDKYKRLSKPLLVDLEDAYGNLPEPPDYTETSPTIKRVESDLQDRFPRSQRLLKKSLDWAKSTKNYPIRMKWAIFDKTKMETLILKLTSFNDFMREMLNSTQLHHLSIKQTRTEFQIMQLNGKIDQLIQFVKSSGVNTRTSHRGQISADPTLALQYLRGFANEDEASGSMHGLAALAQFKALNSAIEDSTLLTDDFTKDLDLGYTASEIRSVELSRQCIEVIDEEEDEAGETQRVEAEYTDPSTRLKKTVWVEWKTYEPPNFQDRGPEEMIHQRVRALATLLKGNNRTNQIRAPRCLGYFRDIDKEGEDHCRFGLVFEKPEGINSSTRPISLFELLNSGADIPSLTDRIQLAFRITECIERLHAVNWLHKGLRSSNILFFNDEGVSSMDLSSPYIAGFDYSRPAQNDDMTERPPENAASDIYRHPRVQGSGNRDSGGFKKSYDLYALGVIILEIAYWKPIDKILSIPDIHSARPSVTMKVRQRLLDDREGFLKFVKSHLGNTVEGVVRACLEGPTAFGLPEGAAEKDEEGEHLQRMFYERVVKELGDMKV